MCALLYTTLERRPYIYGRAPVPACADGHLHHRRQALQNLVRKFLNDENGATAIEYGLIAAGIALAIIAAVNGLGSTLQGTFSTINTSLK